MLMTTPEYFKRPIDIWKEDEWARRTTYLTLTLAFACFGAAALGEFSLAAVLISGTGWMANNAINYFINC